MFLFCWLCPIVVPCSSVGLCRVVWFGVALPWFCGGVLVAVLCCAVLCCCERCCVVLGYVLCLGTRFCCVVVSRCTVVTCPRHHHHQPHKTNPAQSPSPTPSPQWSSPHNTAPPQTETGFETCRGNGRSTTAHSDGTKSHRASRPSASTESQSPPPPGHYRRTATTSSSPSKAMPRSHPRKETP